MKYMKRSGLYQASNYNVTFDPKTTKAYSYKWWAFVAVVDGLVVFNNFRYSVSTSKHQSKIRGLLNTLGIKIDVEMPIPKGLQTIQGIEGKQAMRELIEIGEETLCLKFLEDEIKKQERYDRAKYKRKSKQLETYLETQVNFRDYIIKPYAEYGVFNAIAVHQIVEDIEQDVDNALYNFHRDGFGSVVFYV